MNLFSILNRGYQLSGAQQFKDGGPRNAKTIKGIKARAVAVVNTRKQWLQALMVDETRAWMSIFEKQPEVLSGLVAVLSLVALAKEHEDGHADSPEVRVILGAVSASRQCGAAGGEITPDTAQALSSAASMARQILSACSDAAIEHACVSMHRSLKH